MSDPEQFDSTSHGMTVDEGRAIRDRNSGVQDRNAQAPNSAPWWQELSVPDLTRLIPLFKEPELRRETYPTYDYMSRVGENDPIGGRRVILDEPLQIEPVIGPGRRSMNANQLRNLGQGAIKGAMKNSFDRDIERAKEELRQLGDNQPTSSNQQASLAEWQTEAFNRHDGAIHGSVPTGGQMSREFANLMAGTLPPPLP